MDNKYSRGKIYKIVCNTTGLCYIGSTTEKTLSRRLAQHNYVYKRWKNGKGRKITSFDLMENNNFEIVLVEDCPCDSRDQLHAKERRWIENTVCVNKNMPTRTKQEWYKENKDQIKIQHHEYYEQNKERILEHQYQNRKENKRE